MKQAMKECGYCKEKQIKFKSYLEDIENEKIKECLRASQREKIANGMRCTREDEKLLKEMQKMQMEEKRNIERYEEDRDMMWHQVLLDNVHRKEQEERREASLMQQEMLERRRAYDEQIASANKKRQEIIRIEREKENRRLQKMMKKMKEDHFEAKKRKKDQQMTNRNNYIQGHEMKLSRIRNEMLRAKEIDDGTISAALEDLRREQENNRLHIKKLQMEEQVFVEHFNRERRIASSLEEEADRIALEWKTEEENRTDEYLRRAKEANRINKVRAAQEYQRHLSERNRELEKEKHERSKRMEIVKKTAFNELQKKINSANDEFKRQIDYRISLKKQITDNQKFMEIELADTERRDKPFTRKAIMFKDAMADKSPGNTCKNPVHPFKSVLNSIKPKDTLELPHI